jgi:hypothetical protein
MLQGFEILKQISKMIKVLSGSKPRSLEKKERLR